MNKIFIHIGLHRTGTTFLQQEVFPKLNVNFIHVDAKDIMKKANIKDGQINLLSSEYFSGSPLDFENIHYGSSDRYLIVDKIKNLYPKAELIVVLRDTKDWKRSLYNQYVKSQGHISKEDFDKKFDKSYLDYVTYTDYLNSKFGIMNVHYFNYKDLKDDYQEFLRKICYIIGVQPPIVKNVIYNKSLTRGQERYLEVFRNISNKIIKKVRFGMERMNRVKK
jgi:hypothetical protein